MKTLLITTLLIATFTSTSSMANDDTNSTISIKSKETSSKVVRRAPPTSDCMFGEVECHAEYYKNKPLGGYSDGNGEK